MVEDPCICGANFAQQYDGLQLKTFVAFARALEHDPFQTSEEEEERAEKE